jgi:two-component system, sensor histidine kinase RegB
MKTTLSSPAARSFLSPRRFGAWPLVDGGMTGGRVTLRTLIAIRWIAVVGQLVTVLTVRFGFGFELPLVPALAAIGASVLLNGVAMAQHGGRQRLSDADASLYLTYDTLQLSLLLYLTGGLVNPFAALLLAPATVGAAILSRRATIWLTGLNLVCQTVLAISSLPLPWQERGPAVSPLLSFGLWLSLTVSVVFIAAYVFRVAEEARRFADALAASQMALAREQRLSSLGALAAAAAHELGSPLGTIAVVAKELAHELPKGSPHAEDVALLISQVGRCREILAELARRPEADGGDPYDRLALTAFVEAAALPHRLPTVRFSIERMPHAQPPEPVLHRWPEILHGLGNVIQNAHQFARTTVTVAADWDEDQVTLSVTDDGPGYPPHLLSRLGEPYISARSERAGHMGLGIFIAQTLLQKTGATVTFSNLRSGGARVVIRWARADLEAAGGRKT